MRTTLLCCLNHTNSLDAAVHQCRAPNMYCICMHKHILTTQWNCKIILSCKICSYLNCSPVGTSQTNFNRQDVRVRGGLAFSVNQRPGETDFLWQLITTTQKPVWITIASFLLSRHHIHIALQSITQVILLHTLQHSGIAVIQHSMDNEWVVRLQRLLAYQVAQVWSYMVHAPKNTVRLGRMSDYWGVWRLCSQFHSSTIHGSPNQPFSCNCSYIQS
jgi:hypothetical protein